MKKYSRETLIVGFIFISLGLQAFQKIDQKKEKSDVVVPKGFNVEILGSELGKIRHLSVSENGIIYLNRSKLGEDGTSLLMLKDSNNDGKFDKKLGFGNLPGTGVEVKDGYLFTSSNSAVFKYQLSIQNEVINTEKPEMIVSGLADHGRDNAKPFTLDNEGNLYVTVGSWNDPCRDPKTGKGMMPCPLLDSAGGIWRFSSTKANQSFNEGLRFATGVKNAVAMKWNFETNSLFTVVHGRGAFHDVYPQYYSAQQSAELPAETMYELKEGDDTGWPYVYFDHKQNRKILAPEYGGDGIKTAGENALDPLIAFPAHLGPNDLLFYTGDMFPKKYRNGAFIAFHGQSPELKKGYIVAFVPFRNGKPSGNWEVFADNFAGVDLAKPTGPIQHRPCGLAQGPNGELYVSDDLGGTLYRITYK